MNLNFLDNPTVSAILLGLSMVMLERLFLIAVEKWPRSQVDANSADSDGDKFRDGDLAEIDQEVKHY